MAWIVQRAGRELRFESLNALWDAVRRGEVSIEDRAFDQSRADFVPVPVAELPAPGGWPLPRVNGWYVLGGIVGLRFIAGMFELPLLVELPLQVVLLGLGVLRFLEPRKPQLPHGFENVFRRRR